MIFYVVHFTFLKYGPTFRYIKLVCPQIAPFKIMEQSTSANRLVAEWVGMHGKFILIQH